MGFCFDTYAQPLLPQGRGRRHQGDEGFGIRKNVTSSSSSLSSPGWREKLLQQQSSVCRHGLRDKLTPGHAEHFLSNAGNGMWMGIPKRNPHTAENITDDSKTSSSNSSTSGCCFCSAEDPWLLEKDSKEPIIPVFYVALCCWVSFCFLWLFLLTYPANTVMHRAEKWLAWSPALKN